MMVTEPYVVQQNGWTFRAQPSEDKIRARLLVLLHGWTGNEEVMWIFTHRLARRFWLLAPRGPIATNEGGYGWLPFLPETGPSVADFEPVIDHLTAQIDLWASKNQVDAEKINLMGFSQGASLAYAFAMLKPTRTGSVAALAGSFPAGWENLVGPLDLRDKPFYIAHGTKDYTIPVSQARQAAATLEKLGASVTYCEAEVGHKLSAGCLHGLESFFS
jgi:phospholipase/carboxylesterase